MTRPPTYTPKGVSNDRIYGCMKGINFKYNRSAMRNKQVVRVTLPPAQAIKWPQGIPKSKTEKKGV